MRFFATTLIAIFLLQLSLYAQKGKNVLITGLFDNPAAECVNIGSVKLYIWTGAMPEEIGQTNIGATPDGKGSFAFSVSEVLPGIYFVGYDPQNVKAFVINKDEQIILRGNCHTLTQMRVENSEDNLDFDRLLSQQQRLGQQFGAILQQYQQLGSSAANNPQLVSELNAKLGQIDKKRVFLLDSLKKAKNDFLYKFSTCNTYLSYQNNSKKAGETEAQYFAENFFNFVDFKDTLLWRMPAFHETFKNYSTNITKIGLTNIEQRFSIDKHLSKMKMPSPNHRAALFGVMLGSMGNSEANMVHYCKKYIELYGKGNQAMTNFAAQQLAQIGSAVVGELAPEIAEGDTLRGLHKLSELRGKVVLVDFWASWCGPCRRANPAIKALYEKYKDKGFEIMGVSLDRDDLAWRRAIVKDQLPWIHVSDLQFWSSQWAKLYGVTSIPNGVLIDRDGTILGKGMHPDQVARDLYRIFGY